MSLGQAPLLPVVEWSAAAEVAHLGRECVATLTQLPEGVLLVDSADRVRWANRAAAEMTGWALRELRGMPLGCLISRDEVHQILQVRGATSPLGLQRYHCMLLPKSGGRLEVSVSVGRSRDAAAPATLYLLRDLRRQREVERRLLAQLAERHEMEMFGRQASGIMHDLRHLINLFGLTVRNLLRHHHDATFRADALRTLDDLAHQTGDLLGKLSRPPTRQVLNRQLTTLGDLVRRALDLLAGAGQQADVSATMVQGLDRSLLCEVDAAEMLRVIFNLLLNAYEAVKEGGRVTVRGEVDPDARRVTLVVEDTGPGLPQPYLDNDLFQPFRSTKPGGLGLGLYQAKSIVEAHGGKLEVTNRDNGTGARISICLPAAPGAVPVKQRPRGDVPA